MKLVDLIRAQSSGPTDPNQPISNKRINFAGFPVEIEYPKGSVRELKNDAGETVYKKLMLNDYGFICNTRGRDTDEVDVILGPDENASQVFVAHMVDKGPDIDQREDEDKILIGFSSYNAALTAFHQMYPKDFFGGMSVMSLDDFRKKLATAQLVGREKKIHCQYERFQFSH